jgi:hypothetical protein
VFANFTVGEIYLDIATSAKPLTERIYSSNTALGTHADCNIRVHTVTDTPPSSSTLMLVPFLDGREEQRRLELDVVRV